MCGIGGFNLRPDVSFDDSGFLSQVNRTQHHRGPDDSGQWLAVGSRVGLCHARLAILDLSPAGHQPMHDSRGQLSIVFNGEIYNWRELRKDLEARGHTFRGHSDTEVLLNCYREYGESMLDRLRGMFALAIYDSRADMLFCARDRVGKKPFIYAESSSGFFFASEIPALTRIRGLDLSPNRAAIAAMLLNNMRHIPDPHTAFAGIQRLRPGHMLRVRAGRILDIRRWWTPEADSTEPTAKHLRELLEDCTQIRMVADVPVGALLSGGVDSTAIVSIMQRAAREPIRTYAFGFDPNDEDLQRARSAARTLGCVHKEFYFEPDSQLAVFKQIMHTYGEPVMLLPMVHTYQLCEAIHNDGIRVVLVGHGADEIFYGYGGHVRTAQVSDWLAAADPLLRLLPARLAAIQRLPNALGLALARPGQRKARHYLNSQQACWDDVISADAQQGLANLAAQEMAYWGGLAPSRHFIDESNFCGLLVENTHSVTTSADLPAMMASIEMRAPFLDPRMLAFAFGVHYRRKVPKTNNAGRLKLLLKQAVADVVPAELLYASKRGFGMGIQEEMVLRGPWRQFAGEMLCNADDLGGFFQPAGLRQLWRSFCAGDSSRTATLARMVAIQYWARDIYRAAASRYSTGKHESVSSGAPGLALVSRTAR
jgi:asparagine synthase (glutamine-hydrolysing)